MSNDSKNGGSDLDIFEGLGKKASERFPAAPPPPPGSGSNIPTSRPSRPMVPAEAKKTLAGVALPAPGSSPSVAGPPPTRPSALTPPPGSGRDDLFPSAPPPASRPSAAPTAPPASGSLRAAAPSASKPPPPPPGRGSLPNMPAARASQPPPLPGSNPNVAAARISQPPPLPAPSSPSATQRTTSPPVPPPASTRPLPVSAAAAPPSGKAAPATAKNGSKLEMDWDDDDEATHVFDKDKEPAPAPVAEASAETLQGPPSKEPERASMDAILSSRPPPASASIKSAPPASSPSPPSMGTTQPGHATLSGAFGSLGQPRHKTNGSSPPSAQFRSGPPASQSFRSAPPPPPNTQRNPSTSTAPVPPPPPPGQVTTAPMHMPPSAQHQRPASIPPPPSHAHGPHPHPSVPGQPVPGSVPPPHSVPPHHSQPPQLQMPPVSRAMEATAVVHRPSSSRAPLIVALLLAVAGLCGTLVYFLQPRNGTLVVNVADARGGAVSKLEVLIDGKKACDSAPCIREVSAGVHEVKVVASGFEPPAPRAVTVDGRREAQSDFQLAQSKTAGGTGFKVAASHPGVKLFVDGKDVGPLPQEIRDLEPGDHKLRFASSDRYAPLEKNVTVGKDEIVDVGNIALKVVKGKATIQLGTPGAKVYLVLGTNRKEVPQFPMAIEFDPNEKWELQATKDGFEQFTQPITFDDGQAEKTFMVTLTPKGQAAAPAAAPPPAVAAAPKEPAAAKEPAPAKEPAGKQPASFLKGESEGKAEAKAESKSESKKESAGGGGGEAFLNINSLPASTVVLDGKPLGPTPKVHVSVTPGSHTILFVNAEQSLKKTIEVKVGSGETKAAFAKLRE
jgi:PEGA domain-containing protein